MTILAAALAVALAMDLAPRPAPAPAARGTRSCRRPAAAPATAPTAGTGSTFDHARTGFPLEGQHRTAALPRLPRRVRLQAGRAARLRRLPPRRARRQDGDPLRGLPRRRGVEGDDVRAGGPPPHQLPARRPPRRPALRGVPRRPAGPELLAHHAPLRRLPPGGPGAGRRDRLRPRRRRSATPRTAAAATGRGPSRRATCRATTPASPSGSRQPLRHPVPEVSHDDRHGDVHGRDLRCGGRHLRLPPLPLAARPTPGNTAASPTTRVSARTSHRLLQLSSRRTGRRLMATTATGLAVALLLLAQAAPRTEGKVLQATAARAYLDAGADDGLAVGGEVVFRRAGAEVARCRLEVVSARSASCAVRGARVGDGFPLPGRAAQESPKLLPPPAAPEAIAAQARALAAAPIATVEFSAPAARRGGEAGAARRRGALRGGLGRDERQPVHRDARWALDPLRRRGARAPARPRRAGDPVDPPRPGPRFRPGDASQLYVWQAGLSRDPGGDGAAVSVGRLMAWRIPGATILDGATAGWRLPWLEVGAFGGLVPQPSTLGMTTDRATGGGYWVWDHSFGKGVSLRDEGRLAVVPSPELGTRFEAETRAAARLRPCARPLRLAAARLRRRRAGARECRRGAARGLDATDQPRCGSRDGSPTTGWRCPATRSPWSTRATRAGPRGASRGTVGARSVRRSSAARRRILSIGLDRSWVGPVVDLPRLLFRRGGLSLGYLEEMGWSDGAERLGPGGRPSVGAAAAARAALVVPRVEPRGDAGRVGAGARRGGGHHGDVQRQALGRRPAARVPTGEGASTAGGGAVFATVAARY